MYCMKIVLVGDFPPRGGGVSSHVYLLSKRLVELGHEVFVVTYFHKDLRDIDGIHVIGVKVVDRPLIRPLMFALKASRVLEDLVEREDIDIIHGHTLLGGGLPAVEVGSKYGISTYVTAHGDDMLVYYDKGWLMRKLVERTLDKADNVLAISNRVMDRVVSSNVRGIRDKTFLHWNAVDVGRFKEVSRVSNFKPVVVCVSRLGVRKNIDLLLDAKKGVVNDFDLVIVGDGPERGSLENKVKNENIGGVEFMGFREDVENILPYADLFVLPSVYEGFGIVYIEALACGLPVIGCRMVVLGK